MILADTNIVPEFMKDTPDPHVLAWAQDLGAADLTISVVTVEEVDRGLGRLPPRTPPHGVGTSMGQTDRRVRGHCRQLRPVRGQSHGPDLDPVPGSRASNVIG